MGEAVDGEDGDVVFLAKFLGGVGDEEGGLVAEVADAIEAEELAGPARGELGDAVGHRRARRSPRSQVVADFLIAAAGRRRRQGKAAEGLGDLLGC